jgi:protein tyrosine/serine phosphatase
MGAGAGMPPAVEAAKRGCAERLRVEGAPNLHRVSADLYRGAQPTTEGVQALQAMGVKTIVSLRAFHSDRDEVAGAGIGYERISFKPWHPEDEDVVRFLRIATDPARTPVFVHCQHGADRTGMMCAVYRVVVQGWSRDEAAREMVEGGFGFHAVWRDIREYLAGLDVEGLRRQAGLAPSAGGER